MAIKNRFFLLKTIPWPPSFFLYLPFCTYPDPCTSACPHLYLMVRVKSSIIQLLCGIHTHLYVHSLGAQFPSSFWGCMYVMSVGRKPGTKCGPASPGLHKYSGISTFYPRLTTKPLLHSRRLSVCSSRSSYAFCLFYFSVFSFFFITKAASHGFTGVLLTRSYHVVSQIDFGLFPLSHQRLFLDAMFISPSRIRDFAGFQRFHVFLILGSDIREDRN